MSLLSFSFLGGFTCIGWTVVFSVSKSYWLISGIVSKVRILVMSFSAPNSVSLAFIWWGGRLQKFVQFNEISGRFRPITITSFLCFPHWSNYGRGSSWWLGVLGIIFYGYIKRGWLCSIERGRWRGSVITESIRMADSDMTEIIPDPDKYSEKACSWIWYKALLATGCEVFGVWIRRESSQKVYRESIAVFGGIVYCWNISVV